MAGEKHAQNKPRRAKHAQNLQALSLIEVSPHPHSSINLRFPWRPPDLSRYLSQCVCLCAAGGSPPSAQVARRLLRAGVRRCRNLAVVTRSQVRRGCAKPVVQHGGFSTFSPSSIGSSLAFQPPEPEPGGGRVAVATRPDAPLSSRRPRSTRAAACKEIRATLAPSPSPTPTTNASALSHCAPRLRRRRR